MKGKYVGAVIGVALLAAAPATSSAAPPNEPNAAASCIGILSVFNQAHPEVFGSRASIALGTVELAAEFGFPPGEFYTGFAQVHGPREQCP